MNAMENEVFVEIITKLDYFSELVNYKPEILDNIVIIIPECKYEKLRELFEESVIFNPEVKYAEFNQFKGHPLKISTDIDEIYITIEIYVHQSEEKKVLSEKIKPDEQNLLDALKIAPPIKNLWAIIIQDYIQKHGFLSDAAGDKVQKMMESLDNER